MNKCFEGILPYWDCAWQQTLFYILHTYHLTDETAYVSRIY